MVLDAWDDVHMSAENDWYLFADPDAIPFTWSSFTSAPTASDYADRLLRDCGLIKPREDAASAVGPWKCAARTPIVTRYLSGLRIVEYDLSGVDLLRKDAQPRLDVDAILSADDLAQAADPLDFFATLNPQTPDPMVRSSDPYSFDLDTVSFQIRAEFQMGVPAYKITSYGHTWSLGWYDDAVMDMPPYVERRGGWGGYS